MGSDESKPTVSVFAEGEQPGPFSIRRCPGYEKGICQNPPELQTMQDMILESFKKFANNPYIGFRERNGEKLSNKFTFKTYKECETIAYQFGSGLISLGVQPKDLVGVYSGNCPEWLHMIDVSSLYGHVIAALYDTFGQEIMGKLIKNSELETILVSMKNAPKLLDILKADKFKVQRVIVFTDSNDSYEELKEGFQSCQINFYTFNDILDIGKNDIKPLPKLDEDCIYYICFSSGTTGMPKGVMISNRSQVSNTINVRKQLHFTSQSRHLSYLPLPHVFERAAVSAIMHVGGCVGVFSGSIQKLIEDMQILKPTFLPAVPRVINRIYDNVMNKVHSSSYIKQGIFWGSWYWKRFWLKRGSNSPFTDRLIFDAINKQLGGEISLFIIGGAALNPWIHEFIGFATGSQIAVGYGLSEAGSGVIVNPLEVRYSKPGTVGGPMTNCEVRLEPIQDYDDPTCGEILISGPCNCSGYLNDEMATKNLFIDEKNRHGDGGKKGTNWIHTGDVGKWDDEGYLMIVDRMRSIFKLSQGEYVAAELLTQTYELAKIINQIFIYGDSTRFCLVAVVIPKMEEVAAFLKKDRISQEEYENACNSKELRDFVKEELDKIATEKNLPGYERIRAVTCDSVEWTIANNMLTPTFKLRRKNLTDKYEKVIDDMYESI